MSSGQEVTRLFKEVETWDIVLTLIYFVMR